MAVSALDRVVITGALLLGGPEGENQYETAEYQEKTIVKESNITHPMNGTMTHPTRYWYTAR